MAVTDVSRSDVTVSAPFESRGCSDLVRDLALLDAADKLALLRCGEYQPATKADVDELRAKTRGWFVAGVPFGEFRTSIGPNAS